MKLVLASGNPGKLREIRALLAPFQFEVLSQAELGIAEAEEPHETFLENALAKARHASRAAGLPALADDSGLSVDALGGAPGIHSARYAGPAASDAENSARLLAALSNVPDAKRTARYRCAMVYLRSALDPTPLVCEAEWPGRIARAPAGSGGFGYDPLFVVNESGTTAAQLA
ncbi:MAG TPA: RdgB/HAM1 family non-canonical purine NTP pyrophosphatase, partial [Burkholderiales bacterium]|nr:RdgB/HAM1 family non-canonical purine NTP pyrophosphatase [Burkholderiales bacterium]